MKGYKMTFPTEIPRPISIINIYCLKDNLGVSNKILAAVYITIWVALRRGSCIFRLDPDADSADHGVSPGVSPKEKTACRGHWGTGFAHIERVV